MREKEEKRYCVIDHANKQLDRDRRHSRRRAQRWLRPGTSCSVDPESSEEPLEDEDLAED